MVPKVKRDRWESKANMEELVYEVLSARQERMATSALKDPLVCRDSLGQRETRESTGTWVRQA